VNSLLPYPGNGPGTGCSILFIYYLFTQLGYSIPEIIAAAPGYQNGVLKSTAPLRGVYQNLTGDMGDPFPLFKQLLDSVFPPDKVSSLSGDNPFPLGIRPVLKEVFAGGDGAIYAIMDNGNLLSMTDEERARSDGPITSLEKSESDGISRPCSRGAKA